MIRDPFLKIVAAICLLSTVSSAGAQNRAIEMPLDVGLSDGVQALRLIDERKSRAVIIVSAEAKAALEKIGMDQPDPKTAAEKIAWATKDLREYLQKISGAELAIVGDGETAPEGPRILVGRSKLTQPYESKIPSGLTPQRNEEGFTIIRDGRALILAGNDELPYHGTEYAVYFFLHRLGVRWYLPGEFGEVVPRRATIDVGRLDITDRPDFKMRNWTTHWFADDLRPQEIRWKYRNGMNMNTMHAMPGDSSVRAVLPPESEKNNPEFAEVFARDAAGNVYPFMPNLASDKSVAFAANIIKEHFRKTPDANSWGIGADDGLPRDFSPGVADRHLNLPSLIGRFNDPAGDSTTEEWMQWIQRVSANVRQEFPDRFLSTNGYANRDSPPLGIAPDRSIWIMFAAIWSDTYHAYDNPNSWMTQRQFNMLKSWTSMYDNVYLYDYLYYNLVGCGAPPIPLARRHMHNMPLLKRIGLAGFLDEGRTVRGEAGIFPTYLLARMMWDADLDVAASQREYFKAWYGPAADPAMAFWDAMEDAIEHSNIGGDRDHLLSLIYTPELIERLRGLLEQAETAAKGDAWVETHVKLDRTTFDYLVAYKKMERAEFDADWPVAMRQADAMVEAIRPAMALSRFYWDIADEPKPVVGQAYGFYYWGSVHRRDAYVELAALTTGEKGTLVAVLPETAKFRVDPRDDGRFDGWFNPAWFDSDWDDIQTTKPFFAQREEYLDAEGFPYLGAIWYRLNVDLPAVDGGRRIRLHCLAAETEAWVWVNGKFVGHRPYAEAYLRPNPIDLDVTEAVSAGQKNSIVIRVHTNYQPPQMAGGLVSRLFLYSVSGAK